MTRALPEETAEELYEHAPCGYVSALPNGAIVRVNQTLLDWTGYTREELISGRRFPELLTVPARIFFETHLLPLLCMQGAVSEISCEILRAGHPPLPILLNGIQVVDEASQPMLLRFTVLNATERRSYERELLNARRQAEHYVAIVKDSGDAILSLGADGTIRTWNAAAERLFGYRSTVAVGQPAWSLLQPAGADRASLWTELGAGRTLQLEWVCKDRDGCPVDVSVSLTPHVEPPGELTGVSAILRDIRERKHADAQLHARATELATLNKQLADNNRELDAFTSIVSHDLKEPLRGLSSYASFLLEDYGPRLDETGQSRLRKIVWLTGRMHNLIDDLLSYARLGRQELQARPVALADVLSETLEWMNVRVKETGAEIRMSSPLPIVIADRGLLVNLYQNLLTNALKYNDKEKKWVEIGVVDRDEGPVCYVRDNGIGIPANRHEQIFEMFRRLHARDAYGGGVGAGLSIAKRIVERHGGRIWVESEPDVGTTVYFTLAAGKVG